MKVNEMKPDWRGTDAISKISEYLTRQCTSNDIVIEDVSWKTADRVGPSIVENTHRNNLIFVKQNSHFVWIALIMGSHVLYHEDFDYMRYDIDNSCYDFEVHGYAGIEGIRV